MTGVWLSHATTTFHADRPGGAGGLVAKNAILIVEFARELEFAGRCPLQGRLEASRLRLRPILMTSMAFIHGVVPLVFSSCRAPDAACDGVAVFAGMIGVTAFGLFLTPCSTWRCAAHWQSCAQAPRRDSAHRGVSHAGVGRIGGSRCCGAALHDE